MFLSQQEVKNHEANKGLDFAFQDKVSEEVLRNYLSRSIVMSDEEDPVGNFKMHLEMLLHIGAKYIGRAETSWLPQYEDYASYPDIRENLAFAHEIDPDIVFEACIFETTSRRLEDIPIPAAVFEAFDQPVEERCFRYEDMIFTDGSFWNQWGEEASVPDMTRIETQMFFYHRACAYIDMGFEGLHMGQVLLIGAHDEGWKCWHKVLSMIREYAKAHARRGFVFINAHTHGLVGPDGKLLFDFHAWPFRGAPAEGSVAHFPTESDPQKVELKSGYYDSIYNRSLGGETYSGWSCDSLPYFVEVDNFGVDPETADKPIYDTHFLWGFDEITWFENQPKWYRHEWLNYYYNRVRSMDSVGYAEMPGNRVASMHLPDGSFEKRFYHCHSSQRWEKGFDDEETIRNIWIADRKNR